MEYHIIYLPILLIFLIQSTFTSVTWLQTWDIYIYTPIAYWSGDFVMMTFLGYKRPLKIMTFKALHGVVPSYVSAMLRTYTPYRKLRSSQQNLLTVQSIGQNRMVLDVLVLQPPLYGTRCLQSSDDAILVHVLRQCLRPSLS